MGELDLDRAAEAGVAAGEGDERARDPLGNGLDDSVGETPLEFADAPAQGFGDPGRDARVTEL